MGIPERKEVKLEQYISKSTVRVSHPGILSKCKLRFGRSGLGVSNRLAGDAHAAGPWTTLQVVRV